MRVADGWHSGLWRCFCEGVSLVIRPRQAAVVALQQAGLDDLEVRRDVEVAWDEQAVMPDVVLLVHAIAAGRIVCGLAGDDGQDGETDRLERLRDQRGADRTGGIAALPSASMRRRQGVGTGGTGSK